MTALPVTLVLQLSRAFIGDGDGSARRLVFEVAYRVQELGLLKGYSSFIIAAACIFFAGSALQHELLSGTAVQVLTKNLGAMRTAYSELWLSRTLFEDLVDEYAGLIGNLSQPYDAKGGVDRRVVQRDKGGVGSGPPKRDGLSRRAEKRMKRGVRGKRSGLGVAYDPEVSDTEKGLGRLEI
ncbi:hypothetical protein LTR85_009696 [Meristemomyces frigidus]|nr:hypothetical protein LTR85_009696 [Meristemomyces frigidus]